MIPAMPLTINPATGLSTWITLALQNAVTQFPQVRAAYLFGSRARGDFRPESDIDLAIDAPSMSASDFAQLWDAVNALPIAFPLDCLWLQSISNSPLKAMIQRDAVAL